MTEEAKKALLEQIKKGSNLDIDRLVKKVRIKTPDPDDYLDEDTREFVRERAEKEMLKKINEW